MYSSRSFNHYQLKANFISSIPFPLLSLALHPLTPKDRYYIISSVIQYVSLKDKDLFYKYKISTIITFKN